VRLERDLLVVSRTGHEGHVIDFEFSPLFLQSKPDAVALIAVDDFGAVRREIDRREGRLEERFWLEIEFRRLLQMIPGEPREVVGGTPADRFDLRFLHFRGFDVRFLQSRSEVEDRQQHLGRRLHRFRTAGRGEEHVVNQDSPPFLAKEIGQRGLALLNQNFRQRSLESRLDDSRFRRRNASRRQTVEMRRHGLGPDPLIEVMGGVTLKHGDIAGGEGGAEDFHGRVGGEQ